MVGEKFGIRLTEVISTTDRIEKLEMYQQHGVQEYWIVEPADQYVAVYALSEGVYQRAGVYDVETPLQSSLLPRLEINLGEVFGEAKSSLDVQSPPAQNADPQ